MEMENREKRSSPRWDVWHDANVALMDSRQHCRCQIRNVSLKGLQIMLKSSLPKDSAVNLTVSLSPECVICVESWVAWHKTGDEVNTYGVYFTKICNEDKETIYRFLREHYPEEVNDNWFRDMPLSRPQGDEVMDDRRIFARFPLALSLKYLDPLRNQEGSATTMDLSAKGVGITLDAAFQPSTALELWLSVPSQSEPFYSRGEVVWTKLVGPNQYQSGVNLEKADFMNTGAILRAHKLLR